MALSGATLLLFTRTYPYGLSETFIGTELPYLAAAWKRVVLVPWTVDGTRRPVPPNVEVDDSLGARGGLGKALLPAAMARGTFWSAFFREFFSRPGLCARPGGAVRLAAYLARAEAVRKWVLEKTRPFEETLCYTFWLGAQTLGVGRAKSWNPGIRLISRVHRGDLYEEEATPPYLPLRKETLAGVDRLFCVSEHGLRYLGEKYSVGSGQCSVMRLGVEDPGFETRPSEDGIFRIASCSYLVELKRVGLLLEGVALLARRCPDLIIEWHHLGDGPLRASLEAHAKGALPDSVRCSFHGALEHAEVYGFYRSHPIDLFVNVSKSEGVPVSIMEAQSCGIPVLATAVGGTPEIVRNGHGGVLLGENPSGQEVALALERLAVDRSGLLSMRSASRAAWREFSDAKVQYGEFVETLRGLIPYERSQG